MSALSTAYLQTLVPMHDKRHASSLCPPIPMEAKVQSMRVAEQKGYSAYSLFDAPMISGKICLDMQHSIEL